METKNIYEYANHRDFLQSYLADRKSSIGLRALARKAGFKSPGHVTMLIKGERKLTTRSAELLARAFALKGRKRALLLAFARLDSSRSEKEKSLAQDEIIKLKSYRPEFQLDAKQYSFLATWYYPVVFALIQSVPDEQSPGKLAARLGRGVSAAEIEKAIQDLSFLGLIAQNEKKQWYAVNAAISTPDEVQNIAIGKYHRNMLALAEEALGLPLDEREFNGLTVSVPLRMLPLVKEKIRRFRTELNEMLAREKEAGEVFQLNLQFFPITKNSERKLK